MLKWIRILHFHRGTFAEVDPDVEELEGAALIVSMMTIVTLAVLFTGLLNWPG